MLENWKEIPSWEGFYEVSDYGNIRSMDRIIICKNGNCKFLKSKPIRPLPQKSGHLHVMLCRDATPVNVLVHLAVMAAFVGERPTGLETRHLNGIPTDNRLVNLAYGTGTENRNDAYLHRGRKSGEDCHLAKFSNEDVFKMKSMKGKVKRQDLAETYGISVGHLSRIWNNKGRKYDREAN